MAKAGYMPNRADRPCVGDLLCNLISLGDLIFRASGDRLLDKHGNTREVLQDLKLDITACRHELDVK
jgi:hypothetical protein